MNKDLRRWARWAERLHQALQRHSGDRRMGLVDETGSLAARVENLRRLQNHLSICHSRLWATAANSLLVDLTYETQEAIREADQLQQAVHRSRRQIPMSMRSLL